MFLIEAPCTTFSSTYSITLSLAKPTWVGVTLNTAQSTQTFTIATNPTFVGNRATYTGTLATGTFYQSTKS